MTREFHLKNFKCFADQRVSLERLSVLCGPNAGGKSSVIQGLLLHRLAAMLPNSDSIPLNGPFGLMLGDAAGLVCRSADNSAGDAITLGFSTNGGAPEAAYTLLSEEGRRFLKVAVRPGEAKKHQWSSTSEFAYLSAERLGPRLVQDEYSSDAPFDCLVGFAGQYTAEAIAKHERGRIRESLRVTHGEGASPPLLLQAIETWMSELFGPIEVQTRDNNNAPPSLYFKRPGVIDEWTIASNTGFGFSYALPIVVAGLLVDEGGTLIVDSPEAHLHPAAQTGIARFLCRVAASGVNVVVETHSDYVLDGIRIALTEQGSESLAPDQCKFLSFSVGPDGAREISDVTIKSDGKPSHWPRGFFDQQVINIRQIADNVRGAK